MYDTLTKLPFLAFIIRLKLKKTRNFRKSAVHPLHARKAHNLAETSNGAIASHWAVTGNSPV
jgi:hypothetical protein